MRHHLRAVNQALTARRLMTSEPRPPSCSGQLSFHYDPKERSCDHDVLRLRGYFSLALLSGLWNVGSQTLWSESIFALQLPTCFYLVGAACLCLLGHDHTSADTASALSTMAWTIAQPCSYKHWGGKHELPKLRLAAVCLHDDSVDVTAIETAKVPHTLPSHVGSSFRRSLCVESALYCGGRLHPHTAWR